MIRIALSSIADIVADWFFYESIRDDTDPVVEKYELYLFAFFIVSAGIGGLTLLVLLCKGCCPGSKEKPSMLSCLVDRVDRFLSLEILLEDIPQFVLTSLITIDKGLLTTRAAFNMASSGYNFVFNILDICTPLEDNVIEEEIVEEIVEPSEPGLVPVVEA